MTTLTRHSRAGGNPVGSIISRVAGRHHGLVRYAELLFLLDSRLRGNDGISSFAEKSV
jgi:hypothetical protein